MDTGVNIIRLYGVAGHGKGEVDSAGGGVKSHLRMSTYSTDTFFNNAEEAIRMLEPLPVGKVERVYRLEGDILQPEGHIGLPVTGSESFFSGTITLVDKLLQQNSFVHVVAVWQGITEGYYIQNGDSRGRWSYSQFVLEFSSATQLCAGE